MVRVGGQVWTGGAVYKVPSPLLLTSCPGGASGGWGATDSIKEVEGPRREALGAKTSCRSLGWGLDEAWGVSGRMSGRPVARRRCWRQFGGKAAGGLGAVRCHGGGNWDGAMLT